PIPSGAQVEILDELVVVRGEVCHCRHTDNSYSVGVRLTEPLSLVEVNQLSASNSEFKRSQMAFNGISSGATLTESDSKEHQANRNSTERPFWGS
ncbi:MAG: hypothetical protein ABL958_13230, partial [Bdellovibrionia bacterium]